jgi:ferrous iron transport protein B
MVTERSGLQAPARRVVLCGTESAGKTTLAAALTGRPARDAANYRGSTVAVHRYLGGNLEVVDTPGIVRQSDSETTAMALAALEDDVAVVAVVQATRADDDLAMLLPLLAGRRGIVVLTHRDRLDQATLDAGVRRLKKLLGVPTVAVDAREVDAETVTDVEAAIDQATQLPGNAPRLGWCIEPRPGPFERPRTGPVLAAAALFAPAVAAVTAANTAAGWTEPVVEAALAPLIAASARLPELPAELMAGDYGVTTMLPLLFVWALPTVVVYALLLGAMKASGLLDRLTAAVDPLLRPVGLAGRDAVRVLMGFGCNVPAVISTRSCSSCTRDTTIAAIAFGSACSYQLGATLAVFAAAGRPGLVVPFLAYLLVTTLLFTRLSSHPRARDPGNPLLLERRVFLQRPRLADVWREASVAIRQFLGTAVPVFLLLTLIAAILAWSGLLTWLADVLSPALALVRLPGEAALAVVLASIRKDGLLLLASDDLVLDGLRLLTAVYLAGVLLPCLVTAWTIARERSLQLTLHLLTRQITAALVFTAVLAWGGALLLSVLR